MRYLIVFQMQCGPFFECNYVCLEVIIFLFQFKHTEIIAQCHMFVFDFGFQCFMHFAGDMLHRNMQLLVNLVRKLMSSALGFCSLRL